MKGIKYALIGLCFGFIMSQSEVISWYRIFEMFHFNSWHMFGIIGSAVVTGIVVTWIIKKLELKDHKKEPIVFHNKSKGVARYLLGGILFGLGWALAGACPGPMFVLLGQGQLSILVVIFSAVLGTWLYGAIKGKLPH